MGLLHIPDKLNAIRACEGQRRAPEASKEIIITAPSSTPRIACVQPRVDSDGETAVISFEEYAEPVAHNSAQYDSGLSAELILDQKAWSS